MISIQGYSQGENYPVIDKIAAKVDNYVILRSDIEKGYLEMLSRGMARNDDAKCDLLESLISSKMLLVQAQIDSIDVLDIEVQFELDNRIQYFIAQSGGSEEELEKFYGKSLDQIKEDIREDLKEQLTVQKMRQSITDGVTVTPSEIRKFYNQIPEDSLPYFSEEITAAQIVMKPKVSQTQKDKVIAQLYDLKVQITDGEDFGRLAMKYSEDPGSAPNGGEYSNFIKRGEFVPAFEATAFKLSIGEISDPVETEYGFHIIQLLDRRGNEYRIRHILISPRFSESDMQTTLDELDSIRYAISGSDNVEFETIAKDISEDQITAQNGGYFTDIAGNFKVPVGDLDPNVYFTLDTMQIGNISPAHRFMQPTGKEAARIIFYKDNFAPHQADLNQDWQKIKQATLAQKRQQTEDDWYAQMKDEVFILVDDEYSNCTILNQ